MNESTNSFVFWFGADKITSVLVGFTSLIICSCSAKISCMAFWPYRIAATTSFSGTSFKPPSSIFTRSFVPAIIKSAELSALSVVVGKRTHSPAVFLPTRIPAIGPFHGMFETLNATEAPIIASTSGSFS